MATDEIDTSPAPGKFIILKRPSMTTMTASVLSPAEDRVAARFTVTTGPDQTKRGFKQVQLASFTRDYEFERIWFWGFDLSPGGILLWVRGYFRLAGSPPYGLIFSDLADTPLELGDLPTMRISHAIAEAERYAKTVAGDRRLGQEIAHRVINHLGLRTWRRSHACPICHSDVQPREPGNDYWCPTDGVVTYATLLIGFDPVNSEGELLTPPSA